MSKWKFFIKKPGEEWGDLTFVASSLTGGYVFSQNGRSYYGNIANKAYSLSNWSNRAGESVDFDTLLKRGLLSQSAKQSVIQLLKISFSEKKITDFSESQILEIYNLLNKERAFCADSALDIETKYASLMELADILVDSTKIKRHKKNYGFYYLPEDFNPDIKKEKIVVDDSVVSL